MCCFIAMYSSWVGGICCCHKDFSLKRGADALLRLCNDIFINATRSGQQAFFSMSLLDGDERKKFC